MNRLSRMALLVLLALAASMLVVFDPSDSAANANPGDPVVTRLSRNEGPVSGGQKLIIYGSKLTNVRRVYFGHSVGQAVHQKSSSKIQVTVPPHEPGKVTIRVETNSGKSKASPRSTYRYLPGLEIETASLQPATAGLSVLQTLRAVSGTPPYTWSGQGLPQGLIVTSDGQLQGTPETTGTYNITFKVADTKGLASQRVLILNIPDSLPSDCFDGACAHLTANSQSVTLDPSRVIDVERDSGGSVNALIISGQAPAKNQVLTVGASDELPTGLIAVVKEVSPNSDASDSTVFVQTATPVDAFAQGTVKAVGDVTDSKRSFEGPDKSTRSSPQHSAAAGPSLKCDNNATSELHGFSVTPALKPAVAAIWSHPLWGSGGFYPGAGGLSLFQFDLDGSITVNLGVAVSASSTCTLTLPQYRSAIPAGELGAVLLQIAPSVTFKVSGKLDIRTSITLGCHAEYRYSDREYRTAYCKASGSPLQLTSTTGVDASLAASLNASVTLDDLIGITGTLSASVHAGYHPSTTPRAEVDAQVGYNLGACLACFWKGSPAHVQIAAGEIFRGTLYSTQAKPPPVPASVGSADWKQLSTGSGVTCGIMDSGSLYCWGSDSFGELGNRHGDDKSSPQQITSTSDWAYVSAGSMGACAIKNDGTLWCWGAQTGIGAANQPVTEMTNYSDWVTVSVGYSASCGIRQDGQALCWGFDGDGVLGDGEASQSWKKPTVVAGGHAWSAIASESETTCGVDVGGDVFCWGLNSYGGAGQSSQSAQVLPTPTQVQGSAGYSWANVSVQGYASCAVTTDGTAWCWGGGASPRPESGASTSGVMANFGTGWVSYLLSGDSACGLHPDRTIWCLGNNEVGTFGTGDTVGSRSPKLVAMRRSDWTSMSSNSGTTCALADDQSAWCWGANGVGQAGIGMVSRSLLVPTRVIGPT